MKPTRILQKASTGTFGQVLKKQNRQILKQNIPKPPGFNAIESKFSSQLHELNTHFRNTLNSNKKSKYTKKDVCELLESYVNHGIPGTKKTGDLTPTQRKLLLAAYAKAGKLSASKQNDVDKNGRMKLGLLMNRNWPYLKYISERNGISIVDDNELDDLMYADEIEDMENEVKEDVVVAKTSAKVSNGSFNSLLRNLNKVHQTQMIHVLPTMTDFEASPTIKNVEIGEDEVKNIEHFLHDAKKRLDTREQDLFKAETNLELTTNMIQKHPKTFAHGNFFDPVCIPKTLVSVGEKMFVDINAKQKEVGLQNVGDYKTMKLVNTNGNVGVVNDDVQWNGQINNLYRIFQSVDTPTAFQKQITKLVKSGWVPVESTPNEIILVRNKKEHQHRLIKRGTIVGIMGFLVAAGIFGVNM